MTSPRRATKADVPALASLLARAFFDDPISEFLFPSSSRRLRAMNRFFKIEVGSLYLPRGEIWTTETLDGVAIWATPGKNRPVPLALFNLISMVPYVIGHPMRNARVLSLLERKHPKEPHYYLATLGVDPQKQGTGIGGSLLGVTLSRCDETGTPAYLESSKERNVPLYARHGFEVVEVLDLPLGGPKVWLMWREPRPPDL